MNKIHAERVGEGTVAAEVPSLHEKTDEMGKMWPLWINYQFF